MTADQSKNGPKSMLHSSGTVKICFGAPGVSEPPYNRTSMFGDPSTDLRDQKDCNGIQRPCLTDYNRFIAHSI